MEPIDRVEHAAPRGKEHHAFPRLSLEQIERTKNFGTVEKLSKGTIVFERGQKTVDFFVVIQGTIEVYDLDRYGQPNVFTEHGECNFTGELDLFSDRKILVSGRMGRDGEVVRIDRSHFRQLLAAEPDIGDIVMRAFIFRRLGFLERTLGGAILLGRKNCSSTLRLQKFLGRNSYPFKTLFVDYDDEIVELMSVYSLTPDQLPALICSDQEVVSNPSNLKVARLIGLIEQPGKDIIHDVAIIGAGPGGLAAAVYAASEGLQTVVLEGEAPGGQAGTSSKIENYLGFPTGVSGQELAARAQIQAQKFGAVLALPMQVTGIVGEKSPYEISIQDCDSIRARTIVIATGAKYRTLSVADYERFEGRGIYYAATPIEAKVCENQEVVIVGGGNSAGQAAIYLASKTRHVYMLIRGQGLASSMSDYLSRRILASSNISLHSQSEVVALDGEEILTGVSWKNIVTGDLETHRIRHLFLMLGAVPNSGWLGDRLMKDSAGFICTGQDVSKAERWPLKDREPHLMETSLPGVFAVGDVRSGSVKRVASAVGEGAICIPGVHRLLAELQ